MANKTLVNKDSGGTFKIGATKVSLDSVVHAYRDGCSPECIRDQYPALSLGEVNEAVAFYLENREQVEQYLRDQEARWKALRDKIDANPSRVVERLRALKRARQESK
jgi:uncharacterized protein (DUF433 family)